VTLRLLSEFVCCSVNSERAYAKCKPTLQAAAAAAGAILLLRQKINQ